MSSQNQTGSRRARSVKITGLALIGALGLTGCSEAAKYGWLPSTPGTTTDSDEIIQLWVNSWIAALAIGVLTWGLIIWCIVAYRRRRNETGFPRQITYNLPLEILYVTIPIFMVMVFFYFTDTEQRQITDRADNPDVIIDVRGKQWSWDFNYVKANKYDAGMQAHLDGEEGAAETLPTLYLPVDQTVELRLNSRDVIHSFWVPAFLQKRDMFPGKTNYVTVTPTREGTFDGKCAELCGEYHSEMLFRVKVVDQAEFEQHLSTLESGYLGDEYDRDSYPQEKE
ncbi:cytochrome c oxidase subunit II [Arthrobacter castelli]|uniref:aa3-type cytochrome oxidase subunit II n=1 Tax=Arthrobacter castelli TaxID=271431 RepID=UPI0003F924A1|nr:cytochrome c oxidase subunit II [Arthrobacter castelli]